MIIKKNTWLLRPMPHGINRLKQFLEDGFIAIGYPTGKSFKDRSYNELRDFLEQEKWAEGIGNVNIFVKELQIGDYIVVPDDNKKDVYIGEITSNYYHAPDVDKPNKGSYPHQRKVEWFFDKKPLLRNELPETLRGSLRYPGTIANITKHRKAIEHLILSEESTQDGSRDESNSEELLDSAIHVLKDLLKDPSAEIRLKAAEVILKHYS